MSEPVWVGQDDEDGCGVAVYAMATGRTYGEAAQALGFISDGDGIRFTMMRRHLEVAGFYCRAVLTPADAGGGSWPPLPFAPLHAANVTMPSGNSHYVLMLADGTVLDPLTPTPTELHDYPVCHEVLGLVRG